MEPGYSPKLKVAMEEIKAIIAKYDVGAVVVLHTPHVIEGVEGSEGASEHYLNLTPSYSAIEWKPDGQIIVRGKAEHYGGSKFKAMQQIRNTSNMLVQMIEPLTMILSSLLPFSARIDEVWQAEHTPTKHTPGNPHHN